MRFVRALALVSLATWCCVGEAAAQDVTLPQITVRAPRPAQPARRPAPRPAAAAPTAPAEPPAPLQGEQPIAADRFGAVTVVSGEELRRNPGTTLGDALQTRAGITGSGFAPGASSRPIIRGLDGNRVSITENGIGSGGASDLGEDHFVPVDPVAAEKIEVIRGPATLRYGTAAIGGIVQATNNRVPDAIPPRGFAAELRSAFSSADNGTEGAVILDGGKDRFAWHADAFGRRSGDYFVPGYPYLTPPNPVELPFATQPGAFNGRQPNSWARSAGASVGGSYLFTGGFNGIAITQNNSLYGIPGPDGEGHRTRIDAQQVKVIGKGEYRAGAAIDVVRWWWGATDYKHNELGLADAANPASDGVRQTFTNKELEGRAEAQLAPVNLRFAQLTTTFGVTGAQQQLTAPGDDPASPLNGLFDPNRNARLASYVFNEFKFSEATRAQLAGRIEHVSLQGSSPEFVPDTFAGPGAIGPATSRDLQFTPKSGSFGLLQNLPWYLVGSLTAQYTERAPKPAELFSRGPHDATTTFDIGNPDLKIEAAKTLEAGVRKAKGPFRFEATAYVTRFDGFIFRNLTGNTCNETSCIAGAGLELNQARYAQRDAIFRGGEFQFQWDVEPMWHGFWGVEGQYDIVRATFADGSNVPRIPPQRLGGGVYFRSAEWYARINLLRAFAQNDIAAIGETPTPGYNLLRAELSHTRKLKNDPSGIRELTVGILGNNLLNENIRNHVSYTKDVVLMPGAGVRVFANVKY